MLELFLFEIDVGEEKRHKKKKKKKKGKEKWRVFKSFF
jgi:hypothetical protein